MISAYIVSNEDDFSFANGQLRNFDVLPEVGDYIEVNCKKCNIWKVIRRTHKILRIELYVVSAY